MVNGMIKNANVHMEVNNIVDGMVNGMIKNAINLGLQHCHVYRNNPIFVNKC